MTDHAVLCLADRAFGDDALVVDPWLASWACLLPAEKSSALKSFECLVVCFADACIPLHPKITFAGVT
jgi:hypothetical protein